MMKINLITYNSTVLLGSRSIRSSWIPFEVHSTSSENFLTIQTHEGGQSSEKTIDVTINMKIRQVDRRLFGAMLTTFLFWIHAHQERSLQVLLLQLNRENNSCYQLLSVYNAIIQLYSQASRYHARFVCDFQYLQSHSLFSCVDCNGDTHP